MKKGLLLGVVLVGLCARAQQEPIIRQYMLNKTSFNPAFAGQEESVSLAGVYSHQWAGFTGAPHNIYARIDAPVGKSNVALGLYVYNESIGSRSTTSIAPQFAYRFKLPKGRRLVFGFQPVIGIARENGSQLTTTFDGDAQYKQDFTRMTYNVGVGMAYYSKNVWIGFSVPQLIQNRAAYNRQSTKIQMASFNFNLAMGYNIRVKKNFSIEPSFLVRHSAFTRFVMDLNLNFKYKQIFWAGVFYRISSAYGLMLGVQPAKWLKLGYAGEVAQQMTLLKNNYGTHEVMLGFNIGTQGPRVAQSPRFF
ncbi:MAG: type IX secretion system membrane protein PorP/SprF [Chitinophagales bacterium]